MKAAEFGDYSFSNFVVYIMEYIAIFSAKTTSTTIIYLIQFGWNKTLMTL